MHLCAESIQSYDLMKFYFFHKWKILNGRFKNFVVNMYLGHNRASCQTPSFSNCRDLAKSLEQNIKKSKTEIRKKRKGAANRDFEHF